MGSRTTSTTNTKHTTILGTNDGTGNDLWPGADTRATTRERGKKYMVRAARRYGRGTATNTHAADRHATGTPGARRTTPIGRGSTSAWASTTSTNTGRA